MKRTISCGVYFEITWLATILRMVNLRRTLKSRKTVILSLNNSKPKI